MIYDVAGMRIRIENRCKYTDVFCKEYLSKNQDAPFDFSVKVTDEEFYEEKKISPDYGDGYIENICIYRNICKQMPKYNRFLLHTAVLTVNGDGYAFLGRSGAGKTTHTGLWLQYVKGAEMLNGDKPIVEYDGENFIAYGTPWMGKEGKGRKGKAPIKALCFIEKAKENRIERLSVAELTSRIFTQVLLPEEEDKAEKTLSILDELVQKIPAYVLYCDISKEAVKTSFEKMTQKEWKE